MTATATDPVLDNLVVAIYGQGTAIGEAKDVERIYGAAYAESPYFEGPNDVADFAKGWRYRISQPSFRLVVARLDGAAVGFTFGHQLTAETRWWAGMIDWVAEETVAERPGRTFAVIELAVDQSLRRHGVARLLHAHLLAGLAEERATLLVRPEADAARHAYLSWGYERLGRLRPFPDAPVYDAMVKNLPS